MLYGITVLDEDGHPVPHIVVEHRHVCTSPGADPECTSPRVQRRTNSQGVASFTFAQEIGHSFQAGPEGVYTFGAARAAEPGLFTDALYVTIHVAHVAADQQSPPSADPNIPTESEPDAPGTGEGPGEGSGEGTAVPHSPAHVCGADCTSKEGTCTRMTKATVFCWQHRGHATASEAATQAA